MNVPSTPSAASPAPSWTEADRLAALAAYDILDTPVESDFDDIAKAAAMLCGTPMAVVNLVAEGRQFFKAEVGLGVRTTPLETSFCAHAILTEGFMIVPDAAADLRFKDNPLVTGDSNIRFYAGALLKTPAGLPIGTLCVLDTQAKDLTETQRFVLNTLARQVMAQIELRKALSQRAREDEHRRLIIESAMDYAIISTDLGGTIETWSEGAVRLLGWSKEEMVGQPADVFFTEEDCAAGIPKMEMRNALNLGRGMDERYHRRKDGSRFWASGEIMPLAKENGDPQGFIKILRDRTAEKDAEQALRTSEERLQFALAASGIAGTWDWDIPNNRLYVDPGTAAFYGISTLRAAEGVPVSRFLKGIHPEDRQGVIEGIEGAVRDSGAFRQEYRMAQPGADGSERWVLASGQLHFASNGEPVRYLGLSIDITDQKHQERLQAALLDANDRMRVCATRQDVSRVTSETIARLFDVESVGFYRVDLKSETISVEGETTMPWLGTGADQYNLRDLGTFVDDLQRGDTVVVEDVASDPRTLVGSEELISNGVSSFINVPFLQNGRLSAILFLHDDEPRRWLPREVEFIRNVFDRAHAANQRIDGEEQRRLLMSELQHRVKNTLAMVSAIANQTLRNVDDVEQGRKDFEARLMSLSRANDILTQESWVSATIQNVVTGALGPHQMRDAKRIVISGPSVVLTPKMSLSLSLALHELATNAAKYGALSNDAGIVRISWSVAAREEGPQLRFEWIEEGGPAVAPPTRRGFGTRLIERSLAAEFSGEVSLSYDPAGVVCTIDAPLPSLEQNRF